MIDKQRSTATTSTLALQFFSRLPPTLSKASETLCIRRFDCLVFVLFVDLCR